MLFFSSVGLLVLLCSCVCWCVQLQRCCPHPHAPTQAMLHSHCALPLLLICGTSVFCMRPPCMSCPHTCSCHAGMRLPLAVSYDTTVVFQRLVTAAPALADQCVLHTTSPACATLYMGWLACGALPQQRVQKPAGNLGGLHCQLSARGVHLPRCLAGLFAHSGCVL